MRRAVMCPGSLWLFLFVDFLSQQYDNEPPTLCFLCVREELQVGAVAHSLSGLPREAPSDLWSISDIAPSEPVLDHLPREFISTLYTCCQ